MQTEAALFSMQHINTHEHTNRTDWAKRVLEKSGEALGTFLTSEKEYISDMFRKLTRQCQSCLQRQNISGALTFSFASELSGLDYLRH